MGQASWKPGWRRPPPSMFPIKGKAGEDMIGYVEIIDLKVSVYKNDNNETQFDDDPTVEEGPEVILVLNKKQSVGIRLTRYTAEELSVLKQVIDHAFETAIPIVAKRDENAEVARVNGDDTFFRSYRKSPKPLRRSGQVG